VAFAVCKADPVLTLFAWLSNLATVCLLLLMISTALSVILFFRAEAHGHGKVRTLVFPALGGLGLCLVLALAVANFHVLTGASRQISEGLVSLVLIAAIGGIWLAWRLLKRDPARYARLGQSRI
jgi:amino acid permease